MQGVAVAVAVFVRRIRFWRQLAHVGIGRLVVVGDEGVLVEGELRLLRHLFPLILLECSCLLVCRVLHLWLGGVVVWGYCQVSCRAPHRWLGGVVG